jgi:hypothetical protein
MRSPSGVSTWNSNWAKIGDVASIAAKRNNTFFINFVLFIRRKGEYMKIVFKVLCQKSCFWG